MPQLHRTMWAVLGLAGRWHIVMQPVWAAPSLRPDMIFGKDKAYAAAACYA